MSASMRAPVARAVTLSTVSLLLLLQASAARKDCSECSLEYKPVLHKRTGVPFYNRCLAYCQLGEEEPVEETGTEAVAARAVATSNDTDLQRSGIAKHVKRLLPPPVDANGAVPKHPTPAAVARYSREGYLYAGRPGFAKRQKHTGTHTSTGGGGAPAAHRRAVQDTTATSTSPPQSGDPAPAPGPNADPSPAPDTTYLLRIAFDTGDLYIKAVQKGAMRGMVRAAADPAAKVHDLAQPQLPGGDGSSSRRRVALGATELGDRQQQARRLMQTATPTVVVQNCPNCTEAADTVCRCLTGNDSRVLISSKPVYPLSAVVYITMDGQYACSGSIVGSTGRLVLTAGHCVYDADTFSFFRSFQVIPSLYGGNIAPYWYQYATYAEVKAEYISTEGSLHFDTGVLALARSAGAGGSLGLAAPACGPVSYNLSTAGYPADKPIGTLWYQQGIEATTNVCFGWADKLIGFDVASGQSGSAFWTRDVDGKYRARFTLSYSYLPGKNGAVAITPTTYAWLLQVLTELAGNSTTDSVVPTITAKPTESNGSSASTPTGQLPNQSPSPSLPLPTPLLSSPGPNPQLVSPTSSSPAPPAYPSTSPVSNPSPNPTSGTPPPSSSAPLIPSPKHRHRPSPFPNPTASPSPASAPRSSPESSPLPSPSLTSTTTTISNETAATPPTAQPSPSSPAPTTSRTKKPKIRRRKRPTQRSGESGDTVLLVLKSTD